MVCLGGLEVAQPQPLLLLAAREFLSICNRQARIGSAIFFNDYGPKSLKARSILPRI